MLDSLTHKRITVSTDGNSSPYIIVPKDQVDCIKEIFDRAEIAYSIESDAIRLNQIPVESVINLGRADTVAVQKLLDEAVVKVSISFVDGGYREYYDGNELIERYDSLRQEGLEGKALVHELLSDDWGPPPTRVMLEGKRSDDSDFRVSIAYR